VKRSAKRKTIALSAKKQAELRRVQKLIHGKEKAALGKVATQFRKQQQAAEIELTRAASLLRSERHNQGLSLSDVERRTGISRAAICRLENLVDANPTIATLERMAAALGKRLVIALEDK
jgi:hypothetical protein